MEAFSCGREAGLHQIFRIANKIIFISGRETPRIAYPRPGEEPLWRVLVEPTDICSIASLTGNRESRRLPEITQRDVSPRRFSPFFSAQPLEISERWVIRGG